MIYFSVAFNLRLEYCFISDSRSDSHNKEGYDHLESATVDSDTRQEHSMSRNISSTPYTRLLPNKVESDDFISYAFQIASGMVRYL